MAEFWHNKSVFITGHTGFKGTWISLYLKKLGAKLAGFSLPPVQDEGIYNVTKMDSFMDSTLADIAELDKLTRALTDSNPEIILHLAAQPLVAQSYDDPIETYTTNVIGTANLLQSARGLRNLRGLVVITTDKCYQNNEWLWGYREVDRLGGHDPYSSSKACAELVTESFRNSFFSPEDYDNHGVAIATARAGNVIGGGDWADDRLIPDAVRAIRDNLSLPVRCPNSVRPWQHVLDPLHGYLMLAQKLYENGTEFGEAWNFGPAESSHVAVETVLDSFYRSWPDNAGWSKDPDFHPHEAGLLKLDCSKANQRLAWQPKLDLQKAIKLTVDWYQAYLGEKDMLPFTEQQIQAFITNN